MRTFRLENAAEHPISYGATLDTVLGFDEEAWRMRARRGDQADQASFVAIDEVSGDWVGMMAGQLGDEFGQDPVLTGVYVSAAYRGRTLGIADALLEPVEAWAAALAPTIRLWVFEGSEPAIRFYRRHGYELTGRNRPHGFVPDGRVLEMQRRLHPASASPSPNQQA